MVFLRGTQRGGEGVSLKAGFGRLATMGEAFDILFSNVPELDKQKVEIENALHRVLAADTLSEIDVPHFVKAAMDGYAVSAEDTFGASDSKPLALDVVGSVMPGENSKRPLTRGECIEIGTGAPLPEGADAVVMVEYTEPNTGGVSIRKSVAPRENVIEIGSDLQKGSPVLRPGTVLEPRHLGVLAAAGISTVEVLARPRVALFSTGPEIASPGRELKQGQIYDVNSHTLHGALTTDGCDVVDLGVVPDVADALEAAITRGLDEADFVLLSGGSSLGGGDLVGEIIEKVGRLLLHGVAVKPGKPLVVGLARSPSQSKGKEKLVIGLPGYPMSALSDYYIFVQALLRKAMGLSASPRFIEAALGRKHPSTVGRYEFLPVRLEGDEAIPIVKGSSAISALAEADGFIEIDENTEVLPQGERVKVRLF
jgi:molybdopterin molybdotransferase